MPPAPDPAAGGFVWLRRIGRFALPLALVATYLAIRAWPPDYPADKWRRLADFPGKTTIPCPTQDARTAVLLVAGQSNAANFAEKGYSSAYGDHVVNFFNGACVRAASPLLGGERTAGESLTLLANKLIAAGRYDRVVLVPAAVGGTRIDEFAHGWLKPMLEATNATLAGVYRPTHIIWHQGESDFTSATKPQDYARDFAIVAALLRTRAPEAPLFLSVATKCGFTERWRPDNPIASQQRRLVDPAHGILAGVDTDALLQSADRIEDCHFAAGGQEKFAAAYADLIARTDATRGAKR